MIETAIDGTDTRLLWCGEAICQTRTASDVPTKYHYPQGELRGSQRLYYATDHLGSVREVKDLATGQTLAAFDYTPYGAIRAQSGSLIPDRGYAGMWRHAPTGLYLTHYRAYSPGYGRWLNRDPIFEAGGVNLYAYVENNPLRWIDPNGLSKFDKLYGLPKKFWNWYHRNEKRRGDPDVPDRKTAEELHRDWIDRGKPSPDRKRDRKDKGFVDPDLPGWLIPWPFIPSDLGCGELDCDHDGEPDDEEGDSCK